MPIKNILRLVKANKKTYIRLHKRIVTNMLVAQMERNSEAAFDKYPIYEGDDLGVTYLNKRLTVKFWSPEAEMVMFRLYKEGTGGKPVISYQLTKTPEGVWEIELGEETLKLYYTFHVQFGGNWLMENPGPYAKAVGVNGLRGMVVNMQQTNPKNWNKTKRPPQKSFNDIVLYEMHVRDISISNTSGIRNKGKYMGVIEKNTTSPQNEKTGLDHLLELGITHVHFLPVFDFLTVDESQPDKKQYNWGYDPQNYNVPEGWYASDAFDGRIRIYEFKQMVQTLHENGLRVVMDVVYNHTGVTDESNFEQSVPGYFYRFAPNGNFSNASGCGNETASERYMVRKYIVESVCYWATEYQIDAFRFDLMGIHDMETMKAVRAALDKIDPTIFIYGEGWTGGLSPLPEHERAMKFNTKNLPRIASFSDDFRDAIKGHWSSEQEKGFVSGQEGYEESIKFGVTAACYHPQINFDWVNYSKHPWAGEPNQTINFVSCHDNHTLWDKLSLSSPEANHDQLIKMQKLALGIVLTSQGIPFLHAGVEMARSKNGEHNSYNLPDSINAIDWTKKARYKGLFNYVKNLIQLRLNHPAFRMSSAEMMAKHLDFIPSYNPCFLSYMLKNNANGDSWENIIVAYNGGWDERKFKVPKGQWVVVADKNRVNMKGFDSFSGFEASVPPLSILILVNKESM